MLTSTPYARHPRSVFAIFEDRDAMEIAVDALKREGFGHADVSVLFPCVEGPAPEGEKPTGVLGWLAGAGAVEIPGAGNYVGAGPLLLAMTAPSHHTQPGLEGSFACLGITGSEAKRFETYLREGGHLVCVHLDEGADGERARGVLEKCWGREISMTGAERGGEAPFPDSSVRRDMGVKPERWGHFPEV